MYLKHCWIENIGAISKFNIAMPLNPNGTPKPVVLVGSNGTGKTILLSYIADALIEVAKKGYTDVVLGQGYMSPFFRIIGGKNQKSESTYGFALLSFDLNSQSEESQPICFREFYGENTPENFPKESQDIFNRQFSWETGKKIIDNSNEDVVRKEFNGRSHCFFPYNRFEQPHWLNDASISQKNPFDLDIGFSDRLGERNIIITETYAKNQSWLLHLFLDSRADFNVIQTNDSNPQFFLSENKDNLIKKRRGLDNITAILREILRNNNISLALLPRTSGLSRICVVHDSKIFMPSLQNMSAGQAILFNLFLSIIRHSDTQDSNKITEIGTIEGIVIIDEIDAHIHSDLQYEVLPKLIKLFPKIQFIITSHAPLFVLGMENEFGQDGYALVEMPDGNIISAERFSEFQQSFKYYQKTKSFDDEQREFLKRELQKSTKPLVLTEGNTDPDYIKTAIELLGYTDLVNNIEIEWIGSKRNGQEFFTGDKNLNNTAEFLRANPKFLKNRSIVLLYDFDSKKSDEQEGNLWIHSIKKNIDNTKIKKGIENLISDSLFDPDDERFYSKKEKIGDYGEITIVSEFKKRAFCDYICSERKNPSDFTNFRPLLEFFRQFSSGQSEIEHDTIKP